MSYMDTHAALVPAGGFRELNFDEIDAVNGGMGTFLRAMGGSFVGRALYDLAQHVAEHGGPPLPNMGFH